MPLLKLETTVPLLEEKEKPLLAALSEAVAGAIGKPEQYVMVAASQSAMLMSGKAGEAAFVDIRSIGGLNGDTNRKLSQKICKLLKDSLGIAPDRVYLNFTEIEAGNLLENASQFRIPIPRFGSSDYHRTRSSHLFFTAGRIEEQSRREAEWYAAIELSFSAVWQSLASLHRFLRQ